jgi:hypothetical protein
MSLPVNQRKLEAAEALGQLAEEAGLSLIEMAIAFVINHPAVTSAIIGPPQHRAPGIPTPRRRHPPLHRRARQDRRNRHPGTLINPADASNLTPALEPSTRRRT